MIPLEAAPDEFKPGPAPAWWPADAYAAWLMGDRLAPFDRRFLCAPEIEERTHVALDRNSGAAGDGDLFSTEALALAGLKRFRSSDGGDAEATVTPRYRVRVRAEGWCHDHASQLAGFHTTGGERRLVHYRAVTDEAGWQCPTSIATALSGARAIRMDLVTPAIFGRGWLPNWLDDSGIGAPPALDLQLKLIGAAVGRWRAISGWSLNAATDPNGRLGPKPIRRMVPAGSVYFFEVLAGDPAALASRWLESVSDDDQERRDGFGLAAWGTWNRLQSV
ncbi:MAG TPA: hypothetical protein DCQ98_19905 [Planctomycetaceae bacterium]|nr:hypothetical protein [Planctomycetaceae bacterium]